MIISASQPSPHIPVVPGEGPCAKFGGGAQPDNGGAGPQPGGGGQPDDGTEGPQPGRGAWPGGGAAAPQFMGGPGYGGADSWGGYPFSIFRES